MRLCAQLLSPENWPGVASPRFRAWCHSCCELVCVAAPCVQKTQFPCGHQLLQELRLFGSQGGDTYDQNILFKTFKEASPCHSCCCSCRLLLWGMAVPSPYADLGKSARDFFTKDYGFGIIILGLKMSLRMDWNFPSQAPPTRRPPKWTAAWKQSSDGPKWEWPGLYGEVEWRQCPGHWGHWGRPSPRDWSWPCIHPSRLKREGAVLSSRRVQ